MGLVSIGLVASRLKTSANTNAASRLATIDSLYRHKTYAIDNAAYSKTHDKAFWKGHFYSPKLPLLSTIGAGLYAVYAEITGITFQTRPKAAIGFMSLTIGLIPHLFLLIYFYRFLILLKLSPRSVLWGFASISLGYLGIGFATAINNHTPTATALLISFYYAYRLRKRLSDRRREWALSGFLAALAVTFDHLSVFFGIGLFFYLFNHDRKKTLTYFGMGAIPPLIAHFAISYLSMGLLMPLQWQKGVFYYPGSYWHTPRGFDDLWEPHGTYFFHMLLGHHGYFSMTPVMLLGAWAMGKNIMKRDRHAPEAWLVLLSFAAMAIFYGIYTHSYGGCTVGFRWLIPIMPPFILFSAIWMDKQQNKSWVFLYCLFLFVSIVNALDAVKDPWQCVSAWNRLLIRAGMAYEVKL